jgi:hypothetical protein
LRLQTPVIVMPSTGHAVRASTIVAALMGG